MLKCEKGRARTPESYLRYFFPMTQSLFSSVDVDTFQNRCFVNKKKYLLGWKKRRKRSPFPSVRFIISSKVLGKTGDAVSEKQIVLPSIRGTNLGAHEFRRRGLWMISEISENLRGINITKPNQEIYAVPPWGVNLYKKSARDISYPSIHCDFSSFKRENHRSEISPVLWFRI